MSKSAEAFRTISEVAADLDVQKHVLRFWEARFPQIRPMKRGGGRRYYRPEDLELLRGIRNLLHGEGYTIKGVQKILREQGIDLVKQAGREEPVAKSKSKAEPGKRARKAGQSGPPRSDRIMAAAGTAAAPKLPDVAQAPAALTAGARLRGAIAAPAGHKQASAKDGAPGLSLVEAMIAELEMCRRLLAEEKMPAAEPRDVRRVRTLSRG